MPDSSPSVQLDLDDVLITEELSSRGPRQPNLLAENQALRSLTRQLVHEPNRMLQSLVDLALELCDADAAGVSLVETNPDGEDIFRWVALAGSLSFKVGDCIPRHFSPCGVCLDQGAPVLFSYPERYFTYFQQVNLPLVEGLVLPLIAEEQGLGTIWIMTHNEQRQFDSEDVRIMTSLADFTATTLLLQQGQTGELLAVNATLETSVEEHRQAEAQLQALIANLPGGAAFVVDRDLRYLLADGEALAIAGFKSEDLVGKTIFEALPPELANFYEPRYRQVLAGEPFEHEHQSHGRVYVSRGTPLYSANGDVYAVLVVSYDISERVRVEDERKLAEQTLAADLRDTQLLHQLSTRLVSEGNSQALYQEIVEAAIALTHADAGTVQILDEATQDLVLLATQGFERDLTDHFHRVNACSNTSCGRALITGDRTFIDFDVPESEDPDGSMQIHLEAGYLSAQSTPLIARSGRAIGMVSTHWRKHHRPSDRELRFLDLLARQAADLIEQRQVATALRESEEKYRTLFNSIDEGFCIFELIEDDEGNAVDWIYLEANPAFEQQTGFINPVDRRISEFQPNLERLWFEQFARVARTGQPVRFVQYTEAMDIWYDVYAIRVGGAGDNRVSLLFTDVTDRKRREANLAFLADLMNDFAPLATAEEIMEMAGQRLAEHLNLSRCLFVEIHPEAGDCTYLLPSHPPGQLEISGRYILADYHTEEENRLLSTGHAMIVNDVRDGTRSPEQIAAFEAFDIASIINTPYISHGRWVFDLGVTRSQPSVWREDEIELLREISARLWLRIERARTEASLRESEAKYRSLFESIDEGFCLFEMIYDKNGRVVDYRFLEVNPVFEQQTGLRNVIGKLGSEIAPNTEGYWLETYDAVVKTGTPQRIENYNQATDRWYSAYASRVGGAGSRQVCTVFSDITELKCNEQRQAYLLQLSDTLRLLSDAVEIEAAVTRIALNFFGADRCYYCEIIDGNSIIRRDASRAGLPSVAGVYSLSNFPIFKAVIDAGHPSVVEDDHTTDVLDQALRQLCCEMQVISFIDVPVIKEGEPAGVLCITQTTPRNWTALETELAQETAERIWAAVERTRSEAALRESEIQRVREQSAREKERQRAEALAELNRTKTLFFSNVSHEFRTPLTLLLGPLEDAIADLETLKRENADDASTLQRSNVPTAQLHLAHRNALRLLKLVNTLLDFSRVEAERIQAHYESTDLAAYTADLASVFRSTVESAGLRFIVDCPPLLDPAYIDRAMWEKIVLNLLSNAFKFTFTGEIQVSLRVVGEPESTNADSSPPTCPPPQPSITLTIRDTGIGIPPNELPHIFERFYQSKSSRGRSYEGSGIGLALVQELVKLHGGKINVSSKVGQGTTFTVTLPMGVEHLPADGRLSRQTDLSTPTPKETSASPVATSATAFVKEAQSWLPEQNSELSIGDLGLPEADLIHESPQSSSGNQHPAPKILLVEDNADMRSYLKRLLDPYYAVETAADGLAALATIQDALQDSEGAPYDLVLTDVMMPRMDGLALLRSLRDNSDTREIPIILLSARAGEDAQVEGLATGADDYLVKPFSAQELQARVATHLKLAQMRREAVYREQVMREVQALNETLEQQVQMRTAQLEATNQELEAFSYSVSHDLQTPLRYISSFIERLQAQLNTTHTNANSLRYLSIINQAAGQAQRLINDLLEFSRMGKTPLRLTQVSMDRLVQRGRSQLAPEIANRHIQWHIEPLPEVWGDPTLLQLVWQNLLSNAVKYTREQATARITIGIIPDASEIVFFVQDNGAGFDMKYHDRLFSLFQRLHSQEEFAGTGVGLANVRRIIHRHGGRVWAEGAVDQGATFFFSLPKQEVET